MAIHPLNDRLKVLVDKDEFNLNGNKSLIETGVVVEVPEDLLYFGFHNFAFENSIANKEVLDKVSKLYKSLNGKRIFWEKLQDSGRHMREDGNEYVYLQMSDVMAYADNIDDKGEMISSTSSAGSFNLE